MPTGVYVRHVRHSTTAISPEKRAAVFADWKAGMTYEAIASKYKVHISTVSRITRTEKQTKSPQNAATAPTLPAAVPATELLDAKPVAAKTNDRRSSKYSHLAPEMLSLHTQGYSKLEIAQKLNVTLASVRYHIFKKNAKSVTEGVSTNGHETLDTRFLVGFGCAELERTLTAIAQRLSIAPNVLRQGFSKFLGSTAVR